MNFYRFISPQDKTIIVLEGLSGKPLKEICREYRITEIQYRRWRKHFLLHSPRVFDWDFEDLCRNHAKMGPAIENTGRKADNTAETGASCNDQTIRQAF
jgi:hypothetical protein